jgi:phage shock protein E
MFEVLRNIFSSPKIDYAQLITEGAVILDVRSKGEFSSGHIKGSVNIPVNVLSENLNKLKSKNTPIITCCASGTRSAIAKRILESEGYLNVCNAGSWHSLDQKIN